MTVLHAMKVPTPTWSLSNAVILPVTRVTGLRLHRAVQRSQMTGRRALQLGPRLTMTDIPAKMIRSSMTEKSIPVTDQWALITVQLLNLIKVNNQLLVMPARLPMVLFGQIDAHAGRMTGHTHKTARPMRPTTGEPGNWAALVSADSGDKPYCGKTASKDLPSSGSLALPNLGYFLWLFVCCVIDGMAMLPSITIVFGFPLVGWAFDVGLACPAHPYLCRDAYWKLGMVAYRKWYKPSKCVLYLLIVVALWKKER